MSVTSKSETDAVSVLHPKKERSHEWIDRRSLALEEEVARMLREQPELLNRAKANLERWISQRQPDVPKVMLEWHDILYNWPFEEILSLLTRFDEEARHLRQSSPFCGILPPEKRMAIINEYEALRARCWT
jgi:hypothetical protein